MHRPLPPPPHSPLAYVLCAGFHHTAGNCIEFCFPSLHGKYPAAWDAVPFIALPDGSHKSSEDYVFFTTHDANGERLYGVSCYRQVAANAKLKESDGSVTRSSVQKAVVALVRVPLFGVVRSILSAATHAYFNQENFKETEILSDIYRSINVSLSRADVVKEFFSYVYMGVDVRQMLLKYGRNALVLFKLLLAGKKIILYTSCGIEKICNEVLALCSLVPGGLTHLSVPLLQQAKLKVPLPDHHEAGEREEERKTSPRSWQSQSQHDDLDWTKLGFPLLPFSDADLVQQSWSGVSGKRAHKKMLLYPFASLHALDEMKAADGFLAATSNQLFLSLPADQVHVVVREDGTLEIRSGHEKTGAITTPDKRFIDSVLDTVRRAEDGQFLGSDGWIREQFREYLAGLLSGCGHVPGMFESNGSLRLIPEVLEYGAPFVRDFMQTGCFARWTHSCEKNYCMIGDLILHPSGPPTDALDALSDQAMEISGNLADFRDRAKQKWGSFFGGTTERPEHTISSPIMDAPIDAQLPPPTAVSTNSASPSAATAASPEILRKFKSWWSQPKTDQPKQ